jgi:tyrosine-protein phosphatase YwqE
MLKDKGVLLQVNILSLVGERHPQVKEVAHALAGAGMVDILATDLHRYKQVKQLREALNDQSVAQLVRQNHLLNSKLL